jgi:hypothetical protein
MGRLATNRRKVGHDQAFDPAHSLDRPIGAVRKAGRASMQALRAGACCRKRSNRAGHYGVRDGWCCRCVSKRPGVAALGCCRWRRNVGAIYASLVRASLCPHAEQAKESSMIPRSPITGCGFEATRLKSGELQMGQSAPFFPARIASSAATRRCKASTSAGRALTRLQSGMRSSAFITSSIIPMSVSGGGWVGLVSTSYRRRSTGTLERKQHGHHGASTGFDLPRPQCTKLHQVVHGAQRGATGQGAA